YTDKTSGPDVKTLCMSLTHVAFETHRVPAGKCGNQPAKEDAGRFSLHATIMQRTCFLPLPYRLVFTSELELDARGTARKSPGPARRDHGDPGGRHHGGAGGA